MTETVGKREDDAAFRLVRRRFYRKFGWWITDGGSEQAKHDKRERELMRYFFDAAMERGLEKRGCCSDD